MKAEKQEAEIKLEATKTALDETLVILENLENVTTQEGSTITKEVKEKTKEIVKLKRELEDATIKCDEYEKELKERELELEALKEKIHILNGNKEYLERQIKEQENNLRELITAKKNAN